MKIIIPQEKTKRVNSIFTMMVMFKSSYLLRNFSTSPATGWMSRAQTKTSQALAQVELLIV